MATGKRKPIRYDDVARLEARLTPAVKERIEQACRIQGRTVTDFVVTAADAQARQVIQEHQIIYLSVSQSTAFAEAMLNPPKPTAKAITAARRYKQRSKLSREC